MKRPTQRDRLLDALRSHPEGLSTRYMKRELLITECNGRLSELRAMGYTIEAVGTDEFGFSIQKLLEEPKKRTQTVEQKYDEQGRPAGVVLRYEYV